jgi:DNA-binding GntR family transcriptional regulator
MKPISIKSVLPVRAADEIRAAIVRGALPPGARIKQEELAARLGVSREPVRQALLLLQGEGLVCAAPGRTATVSALDPKFIAEIYQLRGLIEGQVAATLAKRPTVDLSHLDEIIDRGRRAARSGNVAQLIDLDVAFHSGLYEAANNRVMIDVMRGHWNHIRRVMGMVLRKSGYPERVWKEHGAILEAMRSGNPRRARAVAAHHPHAAKLILLGPLGARHGQLGIS